jgi:1-acyl-sn-glycerol-3-phosphate acyltransferase
MITESSTTPDPRTLKPYYFHETRTRRVTIAIFKSLAWFVMKYEFRGVENLPDEGAVVLVSNHVTNFDVFPMQFSIHRPIFFMAKEELMRNPLVEYFLRKGGAFPVHRKTKDPWAKLHAQKVLEHGRVLGIFPEGTRSRGLGLRAAKTGAARFAIQANCPIVPMAINGSQRVLKSFPRRTTVEVKIGTPIYPQANEGALALTDRLMFAIADMLPKELKGVYAVAPNGFGTQLS